MISELIEEDRVEIEMLVDHRHQSMSIIAKCWWRSLDSNNDDELPSIKKKQKSFRLFIFYLYISKM